jgi:hypothetical protein
MRSSTNAYIKTSVILFRKQKKPRIGSAAALACSEQDALAAFKPWLNYSVTYMPCCITHSGTLGGYGVVSETLVGVT